MTPDELSSHEEAARQRGRCAVSRYHDPDLDRAILEQTERPAIQRTRRWLAAPTQTTPLGDWDHAVRERLKLIERLAKRAKK